MARVKRKTGWIKYRICDRSGSGWKTMLWLYAPGIMDEPDEDIREYIIHTRESWAEHAESYSFQFWRNAKPPADVVHKRLVEARQSVHHYRALVKTLTEQLMEIEGDA